MIQSEIQFLLSLVLEHKLPPKAKALCLSRIGEVEKNISPQRQIQQILSPPTNVHIQPPISQAQLKDLEAQAIAANQVPVMPQRLPQLNPMTEVTTSVGAMGSSTRGPNKMRGPLR